MLADDELKRQAQERVGTVLEGKWRLDALLGVGGMASVYAATHRNTKRVAVKLLHAHLAFDTGMRVRFLRESYAANRVNHPGVVTVHDELMTEEAAFLVMDLLEGETVAERWQKHGFRLAPEEVLALGDRLLDTLAAAHDKGVVHRDIKPENLFLTHQGELKVLDFGIARLRELSGGLSATRTGSMLGTPAFMAPEQAKGRWNDVDHFTDLWAVGATMFTLITGEHVHPGNTPNEMLALSITQPARAIRSVLPELHPTVAAVVDRALEYLKRDRWPDARAMQEAIRSATVAIERSGPFIAEAGEAAARYDASLSQQRYAVRSDAATVPADQVPGESASTIANAEVITRGPSRRRGALALAWGALALFGVGIALWLQSEPRSDPSGVPTGRALDAEPKVAASSDAPNEPTSPPVPLSAFPLASLPVEPLPAPSTSASRLRARRPTRTQPAVRDSTAPAPSASADPFARRR